MESFLQTRLFKSNRSQAVRLPKQITFPESVKDVEITAIGRKRIIGLGSNFAQPEQKTKACMSNRLII